MKPPDTETVKKRLVSFLYNLLRDHVLPAEIEGILQGDEKHLWMKGPVSEDKQSIHDAEVQYSNPYLQEYAEDIVGRLFGDKSSKVKKPTFSPRKL